MDKTKLRNFALEARILLEKQIEYKIKTFNIDEDITPEVKGDLFIYKFENSILSLTYSEKNNRQILLSKKSLGIDKIIEKAAYTWFNRFICIRYMEINEILPLSQDFKYLGFNVLSSIEGSQMPDILKFTNVSNENLDIGIDLNEYSKLENDNDKYKYLLLKVCDKMSKVFPDVFGGDTKYIDLLIPDNLLSTNSIISKIVNELDKEDFKEVQIIGWLYQYYNALKKSEAMEKKTQYKKFEIPYVTQLFTPDWIVRYMVENSLLRYYIEHNDSDLYKKEDKNNEAIFKYFVKDNINIAGDRIDPKEIRFLDCCMGSGHILVYAIDVLYEIYLDCGYSKKDIAINILLNNLYGLDIDDRAGQLAILSVLLKLREYDNDIFYKYYNAVGANQKVVGAKLCEPLYIMSMDESNDIPSNVIKYIRGKLEKENNGNDLVRLFEYIINITKDAKEIGSALIIDTETIVVNTKTVGANACGALIDIINQMDFSDAPLYDKFDLDNNKDKIISLIRECVILADKYDVVVTNPPYLNSSKMTNVLKQYVNEHYEDVKSDLFAVFMKRDLMLAKDGSYCAYMTPNVWMFIISFQDIRKDLITQNNIVSLIQFAKGSFFSEATVDICSFVCKKNIKNVEGIYYRLEDFKGGMDVQNKKFLEFKDIDITKNEKPQYKFLVDIDKFNNTPGNVVAYWLSDEYINIFKNSKQLLEIAKPAQGMATGDNKKFVKLWWEVNLNDEYLNAKSAEESKNANKKYVPYNKGGSFRKWYGNNDCILYFKDYGRDIAASSGSVIRNSQLYLQQSITWSKISSGPIAFRYKPFGHVFDVAGTSIFGDKDDLDYLLGLCNSIVIMGILKAISPTLNYEVGQISTIPVKIDRRNDNYKKVNDIVKENIYLSKSDWDSFETSWDFKKHPLV